MQKSEVVEKFSNAVLCYVESNQAYFTTQDLSKQWGDDWNDAPYELNAGLPYGPCWHNKPSEVKKRDGRLCGDSCCASDWNEDGTPRWHIIGVSFRGKFLAPCDIFFSGSSRFSVQDINAGEIPWLQLHRVGREPIHIKVGITLQEFITIVTGAGGSVYGPKIL